MVTGTEYRDAFEEAISATATPESPWYIIPADNKWFARLAVSAAMVQKLEGLDLQYPKVDKVKLEQLAQAKALLLSDKKLKQ